MNANHRHEPAFPVGSGRVGGNLRAVSLLGSVVLTFFLLTEAAEALVEQGTGSALLGVASAGFLVMLLSPVQRFAERVAGAAWLEGRPVEAMTRAEKRGLYHEQAGLAWIDGSLTAKERIFLDGLRDRLGLDPDEAVRIEQQAADEAPAVSVDVEHAAVRHDASTGARGTGMPGFETRPAPLTTWALGQSRGRRAGRA